jgi:hypothetical protein
MPGTSASHSRHRRRSAELARGRPCPDDHRAVLLVDVGQLEVGDFKRSQTLTSYEKHDETFPVVRTGIEEPADLFVLQPAGKLARQPGQAKRQRRVGLDQPLEHGPLEKAADRSYPQPDSRPGEVAPAHQSHPPVEILTTDGAERTIGSDLVSEQSERLAK